MHVLERGENADAEETRLRHAHRADVLEVILDRSGVHELEHQIGTRRRAAPAQEADETRMGEPAPDLTFALQRRERTLLGDPVRTEDLDGDPREEPPIPRLEDFVPLATAKVADRDEVVGDLVVRAEAPALARVRRDLSPRPSSATDVRRRCIRSY